MIKFTTILHDKRVELDISMLEYVVLDTIEKLSKPKFRAHRKTIAEFIGMSRGGLIKAINRLVERDLLVRVNDKELAVTQKWIDETVTGQQSVQQVSTMLTASVNNVDSQQQDRIKELEISERELTFKNLVKQTWTDLGGESFLPNIEAQKFFLHFSECSGKKMAFEKCQTFEIRKRMHKWKLNCYGNQTYSEGRNNA